MNKSNFEEHKYSDSEIRKLVLKQKMKQLSWLNKSKKYRVDENGYVVPIGGDTNENFQGNK